MRPLRLQKFLAQAGLSSRRGGEQIILAGRVMVNGKITRQLGTKIHPDRDRVLVDGSEIHTRRKLYLALHKPRGCLCTRSSTPTDNVIGSLLPPEWSHLFSVGRLDADSEGLILLTNDGDFSNRVSHPRFGASKVYRVTVTGRVAQPLLLRMTTGVADRGETLRAARARLLQTNNTRSTLELTLTEGKNREIRRLLQALDLRVERLIRVQIGPVKLGELPVGKWRTLTESEIKSLLGPL